MVVVEPRREGWRSCVCVGTAAASKRRGSYTASLRRLGAAGCARTCAVMPSSCAGEAGEEVGACCGAEVRPVGARGGARRALRVAQVTTLVLDVVAAAAVLVVARAGRGTLLWLERRCLLRVDAKM